MDDQRVLLLLLVLNLVIGGGLACYCDRYPWASWTRCSKTCNYGTQMRQREMTYDDYYYKNYCNQLCKTSESRACNQEACPINCVLGNYGPWSECSPCANKQFRTRSVVRPSQFGGQPCSDTLSEWRVCYPDKLCKIEEMDCSNKFSCDNGRCIPPNLECNGDDDCGDMSDEKHCGRVKKVCTRSYHSIPSVQLMGSGFDIMAEEIRGDVLENNFYGGVCNTIKNKDKRQTYRIPENLESVVFQMEHVEDFETEAEPTYSEPVELASEQSNDGQFSTQSSDFLWIPIFYIRSSRTRSQGSSSFKTAVKASQQMDSKFFRVHQVVGVSTFKMKQANLHLSGPFLRALSSLPLEYNYALYSRIFQDFGTHYFTSGTLGGQYDLLYQYDREELKNSGVTDSQASDCILKETTKVYFIFPIKTVKKTCTWNKMSEKYEGSFLKSSQKSISMVKGGRTEYAAALAWEKNKVLPSSTIHKDWIESVKDNPTIVNYKLAPILNLVRGLPCATTRRQNLERALMEYLEVFDSCKCNPCPNNGKPVLSGTECMCVCQTGTYGDNCEKRAPDYTSNAVDGYWSCWAPWSACDSSMKRRRTRECNNPSPMNGGKACAGDQQEEADCTISLFQDQGAVCRNDDEFKTEGEEELLPGTEQPGCSQPKPPANSYLRTKERLYRFGEQVEVLCFTGYEVEGYPYFRCLPDRTWDKKSVECIKKSCSRPAVASGISISPFKDDYNIGEDIFLSCASGFRISGTRSYRCAQHLDWEPGVYSQITCEKAKTFVPDAECKLGEKRAGSECVCMSPEQDCRSFVEDICIFDTKTGLSLLKSSCAIHAGRCLGEKLQFLSEGPCPGGAALEWAEFRAGLADKSEKRESCGLDTCYEWETCSYSKCECLLPYNCPKDGKRYCVETGTTKNKRSLNLCFVGAMKCAKLEVNLVHDGQC
ncbi:complement component C6 isoform X1 [Polyodon spathula]|uniref:complement component C6 isoform X1 n=2 Tax=Polyodon spathula TaxID=7913 RepID=UPI001B7D931D|nr:complement component C6 isoform X1 [Polyodon spathula]XP_041085075.1 complement component C6 isoform X1 [Polyodon spathula]